MPSFGKSLFVFSLAISTLLLITPQASANELCTVKERVKRGTQLDDRLRKTFLKKAVQKALNQGYNYAKLSTLYADSQGSVYEDNVFLDELTRSYFGVLGCVALDDENAFRRLWSADAEPQEKNEAVVDLRKFAEALGMGGYGAARPNIGKDNFRVIGSRERILAQYNVKLAATQCRQDLVPKSFSDFSQVKSPAQEAVLKACLEPLRAEAKAVGWTDFPLFRMDEMTDVANKGFRIVSPSAGRSAVGPAKKTNKFGGILMDEKEWGRDWHDNSDLFPDFTGRVLAFAEENGRPQYIIVASNEPQTAKWPEMGVYIAAKYKLNTGRSALTFDNETERYRNAYVQRRDYLKHMNRSQTPSSAESGIKKAAYRALEQYSNVLFLQEENKWDCSTDHYICADKLQAYNTLGPRLNAQGHKPLSTPPGYKAFDTTPK